MTCKEFEQLYPEIAASAHEDSGASDLDSSMLKKIPKNCTKKTKKSKKA
jgi:hypothetical protein